jgi:GT2 family glycosyltransferase
VTAPSGLPPVSRSPDLEPAAGAHGVIAESPARLATPGSISAIVVNYRSYGEVDECLAALRAAGLSDTVVVDHATDAAALDVLRERHAGVTFVACADNPGFGTGMNRGVARSGGRFLLLLNPDTRVAPDAPARLADWLAAHPRCAVVGPQVRTPDGRLEASARRFPSWSTVLGGRSTWLSRRWPGNPLTRRNLLVDPTQAAPVDVDWVSGACMLVRRAAFEAVGGFDERFFLYWEDADLCRRLADRGWTANYHPGCMVTHIGGRSSAHRPLASAIAFHESAFRYFWKHGSAAQRVLAPAVWLALAGRLAARLALRPRARD